jgi:hypothetical protein
MYRKIRCDRYCANFFGLVDQLNRPLISHVFCHAVDVTYFSSSSLKKKHYVEKKFPVTSNLRYMHEVLNVDEIKN